MSNAYVLLVDETVVTVCSSWRNAYLAMLAHYQECDDEWSILSIQHAYVDDSITWMNHHGEISRADIYEEEVDAGVPFNKYGTEVK